MKPKTMVIYGEGIGCHGESKFAYEQAGAEADLIHIRELLQGDVDFNKYQIINFSGGFLNGDILGAGMCAANELLHSGIKDELIDFATEEHGGVIYGQCNGFQLLVKTGLLPGVDEDYSKQTATLQGNTCDSYVVEFVPHITSSGNPAQYNDVEHFAFKNIPTDNNGVFNLWCRHAEGNLQFTAEDIEIMGYDEHTRQVEKVFNEHAFLLYADPESGMRAKSYPNNPNGSYASIGGLTNKNHRIFGHMAHPEVHCVPWTHPNYFKETDRLRREGVKTEDLEKRMDDTMKVGKQIFRNIVDYVR